MAVGLGAAQVLGRLLWRYWSVPLAVVVGWWVSDSWPLIVLRALVCLVVMRWLYALSVRFSAAVAVGSSTVDRHARLRQLAQVSDGNAGLLARLEAAERAPWQGYRRLGRASPNAP